MSCAADFHPLTVADIRSLTDDAVAITFEVPDGLAETYRFLPGQHVTVRAGIDGEDIRRSYSICSPAGGPLRIGVRRIEGGTFSTFATERLRPGDVLEVAPPVGEFVLEPDPARSRHVGAIVAGSGITPVLSILESLLREEPRSRFTLVFGNRDARSVMFLEELEGLKDRYPDRFHLVNVLSREPSVVPLLSGRIDGPKLEALLDTVVDAGTIEAWYLCGPMEMVQTARRTLLERGWEESSVHDELFFAGPPPVRAEPELDDTEGVPVTFTLDGRTTTVRVRPDGAPILDAVLRVRPDAPWSCRGGMCTTCKAQVRSGDARLDRNFALTEEELAQGYILTCQAHPTTDELEITYDR